MHDTHSRKSIIAAQERLRRKHFLPDAVEQKPKHAHPRRERKPLPEFTKNLNASQRGCLTKFTRTGEVDARNRVTEERPSRVARALKRKKQQEAA